MTKEFVEQLWLQKVLNKNGACKNNPGGKGVKKKGKKTPNSCQRDIYKIKLSSIF